MSLSRERTWTTTRGGPLTLHQQLAGGFVVAGVAGVGVLVRGADVVDGQLAVDVLAEELVLLTRGQLAAALEPAHLGVGPGHLALQEAAVSVHGHLHPERTGYLDWQLCSEGGGITP